MSEGGIYIPESAQERPNMGEVMGTGPETAIAVGQTVLYRQWNGITVEVDRQVLVILREEDVLAVVGAAAVEGKE
jgi:chaperonin GroES